MTHTHLHRCAYHGHVAIAKQLIAAGAAIDATSRVSTFVSSDTEMLCCWTKLFSWNTMRLIKSGLHTWCLSIENETLILWNFWLICGMYSTIPYVCGWACEWEESMCVSHVYLWHTYYNHCLIHVLYSKSHEPDLWYRGGVMYEVLLVYRWTVLG